MKIKHIIFIHIIIISLYTLSILFFDIFSDYLLLTQYLVCFILIVANIDKHNIYKYHLLLFSLLPLFFSIQVFLPQLFLHVVLATSIFSLIAIFGYFVKNIHHWHRIQLMLDAFVITLIVIGLIGATLFTRVDTQAISSIQWTFTMIILVVNLLSCILFLLTVTSVTFSKIPLGLIFILVGISLFITHNFIILLVLYNVSIRVVSLEIPLLIGAFTFLSLSSSVPSPTAPIDRDLSLMNDYSNLKKISFTLWLSPISLILYFMGIIHLAHFASIAIAVIIYQLLSFYIQKTSIMEALLDKEREMQSRLEILVKERTKELQTANLSLYEKSTRDQLTGLYNRSHFIHLLEEKTDSGAQPFSIFFMDLDRFKMINDLHGHAMGDRVLQMVAKRLDLDPQCLLARIGGDEFAMLYYSNDTNDLEAMSKRLLALMKNPFIVDAFRFHIGISIGIARYPEDAVSSEMLIKYSDIAMYHAKNIERKDNDRFVLYSSHLIHQIERRNHIEFLLRNADFRTDFELYYQPKFNAKTKELIGFEALIRWHHPEEGMISPAEFIPIAEETGLILSMNDWIFETSIQQICHINHHYNTNLVMSINVSPISLDSITFLTFFKNLVEENDLQPHWIELELTERIALNTSRQIDELLASIGKMGVLLSIDDFGTGYSSLNYIQRYNVDVIKIAKELIDNIDTNFNDRLIVKALINMAKSLGLNTIAEGVETPKQLQILKDLECDAIQGYLLGRPMSFNELEATHLIGL